MPKPERELADVVALPWTPVIGSATAGAACRSPGMKHGPYARPGGALLFETRYRGR